jgi:hypothetical protein
MIPGHFMSNYGEMLIHHSRSISHFRRKRERTSAVFGSLTTSGICRVYQATRLDQGKW